MTAPGPVVGRAAGRLLPGRLPRRLVLLAVVGVSSLSVACSERAREPASASVRLTVDTVAGVEVVRSAGEAPRWTLDTLLSLGSVGGGGEPAPDEFGRVPDVTVGPDGRLYVPDSQNHVVKVFARDGSLSGSFGGEGEGPGEFSSLYSLAWVGDTLLALDYGSGRVGLLSSGGDWLGTRPATAGFTGSPAALGFFPVGPAEVYQIGFDVRDGRFHRSWLRHGPDTVVTLGPVAELPALMGVECTWQNGRIIGWFDHAFSVRARQHPAPGGDVWVGRSDAYRLALLSPAGDTVRVVERAVEPRPVPDEAWEGVLRDFDAWTDRYDSAADCESSRPDRPEHAPFFRAFQVDLEGRLWVERMTADGHLWEVFDRSGALVGAVRGFDYEAERTNPYLGGDEVAWIVADSVLGVPRVHLARVVEEGGRQP